MAKLHSILGSRGLAPQVISLPALAPRGSSSQRVVDWLRHVAPSCPKEDFPAENLPFPFDMDYQDQPTLHPDGASHFDRDFDLGDADWSGQGPATAFLDDLLELSGRPQGARALSAGQDILVEHGEFMAVFSKRLSRHSPVLEGFRSFAFGCTVHLAALSLFLAVPVSSPKGFGGTSDKPIFVRLAETCEVNNPDDPSPASLDSLASSASLARRDPKPEEKNRKEAQKKESAEVEAKQASSEPQTYSRPIEAKVQDRPHLAHQMGHPDRSVENGPLNDSNSLRDSIASAPSVASPERTGSLKAGDEVQAYKDRILAAIHEAAYYPRTALKRLAHGKALVCFTVNKDGSVANIAIVAHADSRILDEAALKIVETASSHFPPLPESLMQEHVSYVVPIVFKKAP